jgi:hypothetical protein
MTHLLAEVTDGDLALFVLVLVLVLAGLVVYFFMMYWRVKQRQDVSPYSGMPMRYATEIPYSARDKVENYLRGLQDYDNSPFDWEKAAFCRETGRIFPKAVSWTGDIKINWTFLAQRYRGNFVSWGSLSEELRKDIIKAHGRLIGFQTAHSSKNPAARMVEEEYALLKPGPLYVDPETKIVMGWKEVPDSIFEVLLVKKPIVVQLLNIEQK